MPYVLVRPRAAIKGQHGAMTRANTALYADPMDVIAYPLPSEVSKARVGAAAATITAGGSDDTQQQEARLGASMKFERQARRSVYGVTAAGKPHMPEDIAPFVNVEPGTPTSVSGSVNFKRGPERGGTTDGESDALRGGVPSLRVSGLLQSNASISGAASPTLRHTASAASPLAPVLVDGIDVQACLMHVGVQKKWFYEESLAELQHEALLAIPPDLRSDIQRRFPGAMKSGRGVLAALATVSQGKQKLAPRPTQGAMAVVGLHEEAREHEQQNQQRRRSQVDHLARSLSRSGSERTPVPEQWTPARIMKELQARGRNAGGNSTSGAPDQTPITRADTFAFRSFEEAAEDFLSTLTPAQADALFDGPLDTSAADESSDESDKLQAMRQQLLARRVDHLKARSRKARAEIDAAQTRAFRGFVYDWFDDTRHAVLAEEARELAAIRAAETAEALRLALAARNQRRVVAAETVTRLVAAQQEELNAETDRRIAEIDATSTEAVRAVQRAYAHTDSHVKTAVTQEREARLRELFAHRRANPATYFPDYAEEEVDAEFVPMRIATADERDRQMLLLDRERAGAEASLDAARERERAERHEAERQRIAGVLVPKPPAAAGGGHARPGADGSSSAGTGAAGSPPP